MFYLQLEDKAKLINPTALIQSQTVYDNDINDLELMHATLAQYQTSDYLAK